MHNGLFGSRSWRRLGGRAVARSSCTCGSGVLHFLIPTLVRGAVSPRRRFRLCEGVKGRDVWTCSCIYAYVCTCGLCVCVQPILICTRAHDTYSHTSILTYTRTHLLTYKHTDIHTNIRTDIQTHFYYIHTYIHTFFIHTDTLTFLNLTNTYIYTYIHTYIHTYDSMRERTFMSGFAAMTLPCVRHDSSYYGK